MTAANLYHRAPNDALNVGAPRFAFAVNAAHRFLINAHIARFPVDVEALIALVGVSIHRYSTMAASLRVSGDDVARLLRTRDAAAVHHHGCCFVVYNDAMQPERVRFSLMHELGHIVLGHMDTPFAGADAEREAHCFSRNILAPPLLSEYLFRRAPERAASLLGVSHAAWDMRRATLLSDIVLLTPANRREQRALLQRCGGLACSQCGAPAGHGGHCAICGGRDIRWREKDMQYNDGYELDEYARVRNCARCGNDQLSDEAQFCQICGTPLYNRCTSRSCQTAAQGNARFCVLCGAPTTFLATGLLKTVGEKDE